MIRIISTISFNLNIELMMERIFFPSGKLLHLTVITAFYSKKIMNLLVGWIVPRMCLSLSKVITPCVIAQQNTKFSFNVSLNLKIIQISTFQVQKERNVLLISLLMKEDKNSHANFPLRRLENIPLRSWSVRSDWTTSLLSSTHTMRLRST